MTRARLFRLRLLYSAGALIVLFAPIRLLWYPGGYFALSGVSTLLWVLLGVSFVIGPVLSTFLYKPGKKGLVADLWIVAGIELFAIIVATSIIYARQPYFTVFAVDRFEIVTLGEVTQPDTAIAMFNGRPGHRPRLVFAALPEDPDVFSKLIEETVFEGKPDIDRRPEFWQPYTSGLQAIKAAAKPLGEMLTDADERAARVRNWLARQSEAADDFLYLPIRGNSGDGALILHADIGFPVAILDVDPWR